MQTNEILEAIDQKISQLQQARALLTNQASQLQTGKRRGRPKSSDSKTAKVSAPAAVKTSKRTMSEEGKARIAAAQKARWAAKKKATKAAVTKSAPVTGRKAIKSAPKPGKKSVAPAKKTARVKSAPVVKTSATEAVAAGPNPASPSPVNDSSQDKMIRQRAHAERMLARAERRYRQASRLLEKWKLRITELDRAGVAAKQARLWSDELPEPTAKGSDTATTDLRDSPGNCC